MFNFRSHRFSSAGKNRMLVTNTNVKAILALMRTRYPKWSGFHDERFAREELNAKKDTIWKTHDLINPQTFSQLMEEGRYDEVLFRLDYVARANIEFSRNMPTVSDLEILKQDKLSKEEFCQALYELMYGSGKGSDGNFNRQESVIIRFNQPMKHRSRSHQSSKSNPRRHSRPDSGPKPRSRPAPMHTRSAPDHRMVEGVLDRKGRVGFVLSEQPGQSDVLVEGASLAMAMNGDRVRVAIKRVDNSGRRMGEIVSVLVHARKTMTGLFRSANGRDTVETDGAPPLKIVDRAGLSPRTGDVVAARIASWPSPRSEAAGVLVSVLGDPSRPETDVVRVLSDHEIPVPFPADADAQASSFGSQVPESALAGRRTFFDERVFTIDGADAKDFDDAVHVEVLANGAGWRLGVHIADVSHYVTDGTPLDRIARERGTSVYFPGRVVPMLPFALSDNLCSLRPNEVRLTLTCVMDINSAGKVIEHRLYESAIRSAKRFTYDEVEAILHGEEPSDVSQGIIRDVREMGRLARLLRQRRMERGSLDFDFPEPDVTTDPHGRVTDIQKKERLESHRLIEDFMLLANETVALHMKPFPFLYRVHEKPDPAKLETLKKTLDSVGLSVGKSSDLSSPLRLQRVLADAAGRPVQTLVHLLVLRSLKQAVYSPSNAGHFGLASPCYTHFTSPIRRYPDLIVHRLVREHLRGQLTRERQAHWAQLLPALCEDCSRLERRAVQAERDLMAMQRVRLMENKIGQEHDGVISSVTAFGFFVELSAHFVEGLVRISDLPDFYIFDPVRMVLRGKRTGKVFSLGQAVRVRVAGANLAKGQLDFDLVKSGAEKPRHNGPHRR